MCIKYLVALTGLAPAKVPLLRREAVLIRHEPTEPLKNLVGYSGNAPESYAYLAIKWSIKPPAVFQLISHENWCIIKESNLYLSRSMREALYVELIMRKLASYFENRHSVSLTGTYQKEFGIMSNNRWLILGISTKPLGRTFSRRLHHLT